MDGWQVEGGVKLVDVWAQTLDSPLNQILLEFQVPLEPLIHPRNRQWYYICQTSFVLWGSDYLSITEEMVKLEKSIFYIAYVPSYFNYFFQSFRGNTPIFQLQPKGKVIHQRISKSFPIHAVALKLYEGLCNINYPPTVPLFNIQYLVVSKIIIYPSQI